MTLPLRQTKKILSYRPTLKTTQATLCQCYSVTLLDKRKHHCLCLIYPNPIAIVPTLVFEVVIWGKTEGKSS